MKLAWVLNVGCLLAAAVAAWCVVMVLVADDPLWWAVAGAGCALGVGALDAFAEGARTRYDRHMTAAAVVYRTGYGPVTFRSADGITTVEAHRRADGDWGWTKYRSGRKVGWNGQGIRRYRAIAQAEREAGPDARRVAG